MKRGIALSSVQWALRGAPYEGADFREIAGTDWSAPLSASDLVTGLLFRSICILFRALRPNCMQAISLHARSRRHSSPFAFLLPSALPLIPPISRRSTCARPRPCLQTSTSGRT